MAAQQRTACFVEDDDCSNPHVNRPIRSLISRRAWLGAGAAIAAGGVLGGRPSGAELLNNEPEKSSSTFTFSEIKHGLDAAAHVPDGYDLNVLMRWGDAVTSDAPDFDPRKQSPTSQSNQFGYNCDFISFFSLPSGGDGVERGLLCVNHEYTDTNLMFPGLSKLEDLQHLSVEQVEIELAAHGHSIVEVQKRDGVWKPVRDSRLNRRITARDTMMNVSGPAAGHARLCTSQDPTGRRVLGTLNNCAGGVTPWGTLLICEENFNYYFSGDPEKTGESEHLQRYGINGESRFSPSWAKHFSRFNIEKEPNEPNRFGWVVEFDPREPGSVPIKRTALGRFKHEGAGVVLNSDGRVVLYGGDDERFEYVYRFVTNGKYKPGNDEANRNLLDDGVLSVARFDEKGFVRWLPLQFGVGPLTAENGFHSQADVVIETRRAADLVGATPMDRPEDVEASPTSGHVFVILTNNDRRSPDQVDAVNPRAENVHGHILELIPPTSRGNLDHTAVAFRWETFLRAGDPNSPEDKASYHPDVTEHGWFSCPDNGTFDREGRLWLTTDCDQERTGFGDGVYACDTEGPGRALTKCFFRGPRGSEVSGVCLSPDNETLFVSVQHPGEESDSNYDKPTTRWPDFDPQLPPRPSVVAITRKGGGKIGA